MKKNLLKKKFKKKLSNIKVVGHPKYDLLNYPYYNFYKNEVEMIKNKYKKFIFIPSSFTHDLKGSNDYSKYLFKNFAKNKILKKKLKDSINTWDIDIKNYNSFLDLVKKLANDNRSFNFIFRPHPTQDINKIKNRIQNRPENLHIIYEYSITPWLLSCDYYLHSHCTSVYDAAKLKKKIFCFNLNTNKKGVKLVRNPDIILMMLKNLESFLKKSWIKRLNMILKKSF